MINIREILSSPKFIEGYNDDYLRTCMKKFSNRLIGLNLHEVTLGHEDLLVGDILFDKDELYFLEFYIKKCKINKDGYCEYEEETKLYQSVLNEIFVVFYTYPDYVIHKLTIHSFENNSISFMVIKE